METDPRAETIHRLLTTANLQRMRGDLGGAATACRQALEADPRNATALDLMGDLLNAQGEIEAAMEHYQRAFEAERRPATEEKIARLALRIQAQKEAEVPGMGWEVGGGTQRRLNASMACGLSMLFAGLGQLYNGQHIKGFALFGGWLIGILSLGMLGAQHARALYSALFGSAGDVGGGPPVPPMLWALLVVMVVVWVYSLLDASLTANAINRGQGPGAKTGWEV